MKEETLPLYSPNPPLEYPRALTSPAVKDPWNLVSLSLSQVAFDRGVLFHFFFSSYSVKCSEHTLEITAFSAPEGAPQGLVGLGCRA